MVSFGKSKGDKATGNQRYRYSSSSVANDEMSDVLLTDEKEPPLAAALVEPETHKDDEVIYELVVEDEKAIPASESGAAESGDMPSLDEQVARLCHEYAAINQQLEKSLVASHDLAKQLEKSKKTVAASYVALGVAGFSLLLGLGAIGFAFSMQRDIDDSRKSLAALANQTSAAKKELDLNVQKADGKIVQLNEKVDKIFASDNLDSVLEVTKELQKQVSALANKNLAAMASRSHAETHQPKENSISLPGLKIKLAEEPASDKKAASAQAVKKSAPPAKPPAEKKPQKTESSAHDDNEAVPAKQKKHRWHKKAVSAQIKNQPKPEPIAKPAKSPSPPMLPKLD